MNIIVCAKLVIDVSEMRVDPGTNKPILEGVPRKISDIDKNAMEEAIRIKEKLGGKITTLTVGPQEAREKIKVLLAMGADEAVLVSPPGESDYYLLSRILAEAVKKVGEYDIVLFGEASIDMFSGQVGPKVAGLLGIPQITYGQRVTAEADKVVVDRNMGDKMVTTESTYPVAITVTKEINEPRLPSLIQILGSAKKPIDDWTHDSILAEGGGPKVATLDIRGLPMERKNIVLEGDIEETTRQLAENLAKEGLIK